MHYMKFFMGAFLISTCFMTGCSYIYGENTVIVNRDTDYLKARSIPPLKIPPGLASGTVAAHYPVSERPYSGNLQKPDLTPPELNSSGQ